MKEIFSEKHIEEYSLALLRWAYGKTGSRSAAEDLAQEVWVQVYQSVQKGTDVRQPERYLWKIARYVWCRHLRSTVYCGDFEPIEEHDVAAEDSNHAQRYAEEAEKAYFLQKMRRKLMELNRLQREIMIRYYIEDQPQKVIAQELGIAVSTVKWHLLETRQRLKENIMEQNEFVYRPRKMFLSIAGRVENFDTNNGIQSSLSRQNICLACYRKAQSLESLSRMLGIPQAYVENDVQWLVDKELLEQKGNLYQTAFLIESRQEAQEKHAVYLKRKAELSDVIVKELLAAEGRIRAIGFRGSDQPMNKLLWLLIYRLGDVLLTEEKEAEPPIRKDGGKYHMLGFDTAEPEEMILDTKGWKKNGTMSNAEGFFWFGMDHFDFADPVHLFLGERGEWARLNAALCKVLNGNDEISLMSEEERYDVSVLIEKGFLKREGSKTVPAFCVFTEQEYQKLKTHVFWPIARKLRDVLRRRDAELEALCRRQLPQHLAYLLPFAAQMAKYNLSFLTTFFASEDGYLYRPQSEKDGAMLTLMYIKPE